MACRRGCGAVRHLEVKQLYIQKLTNSGRITTFEERISLNIADIGTKELVAATMVKHLTAVGYRLLTEWGSLQDLQIKPRRGKVPDVLHASLLRKLMILAGLVVPSRGLSMESEEASAGLSVVAFLLLIVTLQFALILCLVGSWCSSRCARREKILLEDGDTGAPGKLPTAAAGNSTREQQKTPTDPLSERILWQTRNGEVFHLYEKCGYLQDRHPKPVRICKQCKQIHQDEASKKFE